MNKSNENNERRGRLRFAILLLTALALCLSASQNPAECSEIWEAVSNDYREAVSQEENDETTEKPLASGEGSDLIEIEYDGRIISVDIRDLIFMADNRGGQTLELDDPSKYADQLEKAPLYGIGSGAESYGNTVEYERNEVYPEDAFGANPASGSQEITEREYEEEQRARRWREVFEDLTLREIDDRALELVKEFGEAKDAIPPITGVAGSVVIAWSSYTPKIVCRPLYVTDIILQPGESVTGVHPGDPVRWSFVPSVSGSGESAQTHVLIKPLASDISTNVIINTDRRTYQLDLMSSARDFMPSVSFSYPADSLKAWDSYLAEKRRERESSVTLASGYSIDPSDLHLGYEIRGKDSLRWKPLRVWDDGIKTYIRFRKGSAVKSVDAPVLVVYEHKKEVLVNYRAAPDMYIVDRVFDKAALIVGTGPAQDRVVITRLKNK